ncbi:MAG: hypothetical protein ABSB35_41855 [Bryobacteraceae bacterium]|jgi:hypothetical protein
MTPLPTPHVPGDNDGERFDNAVRKVLTVSKADLLKAEAKWKHKRAKKRIRQTPH